jgi:hypothetical protein
MAQVGSGGHFVDAEWVAGYYWKNLFIVARLTALAEPGNRMVIYGQGDIPFPRRFHGVGGRSMLEDPRRYAPA